MYDDLIKRLIWTANNDEKPFDAETAFLAAKAIEKLILERDAAVEDLKMFSNCKVCKHNHNWNCPNYKSHNCLFVSDNGEITRPLWEWRGPQEENND